MNFQTALRQAYAKNPCQVLPNPLWKTLAHLQGCLVNFRTTGPGGDTVTHLEAWLENQLLVYWDEDRTHLNHSGGSSETLSFALAHQDYLPAFPLERYSSREAFFRLIWYPGQPLRAELPAGFSFYPALPELDSQKMADLIAQCYSDLHPSPETIQGWGEHPTYHPDLWIWIWDQKLKRAAGLGIAELDTEMGEGSLEWIQLLPHYRGMGLGSALVYELLRRTQNEAAWVTVSGAVDNLTRPERLYRACGFQGQDVWYVLRA